MEINEISNSKLKENLSSRGENISSKELQKLCNASIKFTMLNVSKNKIVNFKFITNEKKPVFFPTFSNGG